MHPYRKISTTVLSLTIGLSAISIPTALGDSVAAETAVELSSMEKGYFGEQHVDEFWRAAARRPLIDKWHPTANGPDALYLLADGNLELHEVKTFTSWPGREALATEVSGQKMEQLSDQWIREWIKRVRASPASAKELEAAEAVEGALRSGRLARVYDEVNLQTGQWRVSNAHPAGSSSITLTERAGPMRIANIGRKLAASRADLASRLQARAAGKPPVSLIYRPGLPPRSPSMPSVVGPVLGGIAVPLGAMVVIDGVSELNSGEVFDGTTHVAEGTLISASGVVLIAGEVALSAGLAGGAAMVDGIRDIQHGWVNDSNGRVAVGSVKVTAGGAIVVGACTGNPAMIIGGTVVYVGVVFGDVVVEATQTRHPDFGTDDIQWRSPSDCGMEWLLPRG